MNISTLSPVTCANWCETGDGHVHETHTEDQYCMGASRVVPVSTEAGTLAVYETQAPGQPVLVNISHNDAFGARLTLDEVRALRDELDSILSAASALEAA